MKIIGSSQEAERLSKEIVMAVNEMVQETNRIGQALGKLEESFLDDEVLQIEVIIEQIMKTMTAYMDDISNVKMVMDGYAEVLKKRGR